MAFADQVVHVTLSGQMLNGAEEWQTGFWMGYSEGPADVPTQGFVDAVRDAWIPFFNGTENAISTAYSFTQVKAARVNIGGLYDGSGVVVSNPGTAVVGTRGGSPLPPQCALVATLIGGSGKGLAGKGRMYLPGVVDAVDATGHINSIVAQNIADNLAAFFDSVNSTIGAPGVAINASKGHSKLAGIGARNVPINGVRVGNVYDTQRRRRNALAETYFNADLTSN